MFARDTLPFLSYFRKVSKEFVKLNGFKKEFSCVSMQELFWLYLERILMEKLNFEPPFISFIT